LWAITGIWAWKTLPNTAGTGLLMMIAFLILFGSV